jgi:multiple sugar transport system substrate-binding protein
VIRRHLSVLTAVLVVLLLVLSACGSPAQDAPAQPAATPGTGAVDEPVVDPAADPAEQPAEEPADVAAEPTATAIAGREQVSLWSHSAGNPDEIAVVNQMIDDFNAQSDTYQVVLESFPQAAYNEAVAAASVAGSLPCIVDLDAPTVPNFAWAGYIQPLQISAQELAELDVLDPAVGRWQDEVYSLGQFDVALLIYARQSVLDEYGIRVPTLDEPWTREEFDEVLATLDEADEFEYAIDVNPTYAGEWWPYAYSPMLQSFGGDLINRDNMVEAEGVLNGPEAVEWGEWFQGLFANGYAPANPADDQGFLQGRIALWYSGSWSAQAVRDAYGEDALFLPPPDFGEGPKIGAGSWQFGVSSTCPHPQGATDFIMFTMQPEQVALMADSSSLIPTTSGGAEMSEDFGEGSVFRDFYDMAERFAVIRPPTPGYLTISSQFEQAGLRIRDGGNVQDALDDAVDAIERDIESNNGYGFQQ